MKFRKLFPDEIEIRVQRVTEKGAQLLLYKDARCDMRILDETVGAENWQREHYECKGNLFCRVGINVAATIDMSGSEGIAEIAEHWVWKSDCGTESNTEAQKGEASDSFKRACFNWGIGRELYTSPFIWIKQDGSYDFKRDRFTVSEIEYKNDRISRLVLDATVNHQTKLAAFKWYEKERKKLEQRIKLEPPICPVCGKEVKPAKYKGTELSAQEFFEKFGLCVECVKAGLPHDAN